MKASSDKISSVKMARTLFGSAAQLYPEPGLKRVKDKVKYWMRGLATPELTRQWFQILAQPELSDIVHVHPRLMSKLQRPYLHRNLKPRQRLEVLREHFTFVIAKLSPRDSEKIYSPDGLKLADISLEGVGDFSLQLFYRDRFEKEGELMVALCSAGGKRMIFTLSFTVTAFNQTESSLFIGGLQSFKIQDAREVVVSVTRGMHGLRPKGLLLFTVQQLAKIWGVKTIRAVSNDLNIFQDFRLKKKKVLADYNEFWLESDGNLDADGLFSLPLTFTPRPMTDIKPNKRSLYKQRYAMLEDLATKIAASLQPC